MSIWDIGMIKCMHVASSFLLLQIPYLFSQSLYFASRCVAVVKPAALLLVLDWGGTLCYVNWLCNFRQVPESSWPST